jgi:hypothetical protein
MTFDRALTCTGLAAAGTMLALAAPAAATQLRHADWTQAGHDAARTGFNPFETSLEPPYARAWSGTGQPAGRDGVVASDGVVLGIAFTGLTALDAETGDVRWSQIAEGRYVGLGAQRGVGYVVDDRNGNQVTGRDPALSAFRLADGGPLWTRPGGQPLTDGEFPDCAMPALTRHSVFVSTASYDRSVDPPRGTWSVRAYDATTGQPQWRHAPTFPSPVCAPSVGWRGVYAVAEDGEGGAKLIALDRHTGRQRWALRLPAGVHTDRAPVIANGRAYLIASTDSPDDSLVVVNLAFRAVERIVPVARAARRPTLDRAGRVYVAGCGGISKHDARGKLLRSATIEDTEGCGEGQSTPLANRLLYVVAFDDVYVIDTKTLAIVDDIFVSGFVGAPVVANGQMLIGGDFGVSAWRAAP